MNPARLSDIENAISREDLRGLVTDGAIKARQKKGVSRGRARARIAQRSYGHRKGAGKRKGAAGARNPSKTASVQKIRAIRKVLVELRTAGPLTGTCTASSTAKRPGASSGASRT